VSSGLPTGAFMPADLSPGHTGAGQIFPAHAKTRASQRPRRYII
jgi:hypothetical protein